MKAEGLVSCGKHRKRRITKDSLSFIPYQLCPWGRENSDFQKFHSQRQQCLYCDVKTRASSDSPIPDFMSSGSFLVPLKICSSRGRMKKIQILDISESFTVISHGNGWLLITIWFCLTTGRKGDCYANLNNSSLGDNSIFHFKLIYCQLAAFLRSSVHFRL